MHRHSHDGAQNLAPQPEAWWKEVGAALRGKPRDYTSGSLGKAILLLAIPMVLEMSMQAVFAVVDVYFVGRLGPEAVAVVGISDSLLTIVFAVSMGLSMATTAMVARRVGEGDVEDAGVAAVQALLLGILVSIVSGFGGWWWAADLLALMGGSPSLINTGSGFTAILLGGNITVMLLFLINAVFRGAGDAAVAMRALWLANLVNIVLDPLLIFGLWGFPELGLEGAAIATTVGRATGVAYQFYRLFWGAGTVNLRHVPWRVEPAVLWRLIRVSSVGILQFLIGMSSWLVLVRILAVFGGVTVAAYTIAVRIIIFALLPSWGMGNAAATLVGQSLGAGKPDRAARAVWITGLANMVFLSLVATLFIFSAESFVSVFSAQHEVLRQAAECLRIVAFSYPFLAFGMVTVQAFNGAGDTATPTWINLFCYWIFELPFAYLLALQAGWGPMGVFVAIALAQALLAAVGVWQFSRGSWKAQVI